MAQSPGQVLSFLWVIAGVCSTVRALQAPSHHGRQLRSRDYECGGISGLYSCGGSFPSTFCCPSGSQCFPLNANNTYAAAICCPAGEDCFAIASVSCDQSALDPIKNPSSQIHSVPMVNLTTCGNECCPPGYQCSQSGVCTALDTVTSAILSIMSATQSTSVRIATPTPVFFTIVTPATESSTIATPPPVSVSTPTWYGASTPSAYSVTTPTTTCNLTTTVNMAPMTMPAITGVQQPTKTSTATPKDEVSLSPGRVAGVAIGSAALSTLLIVLGIFAYHRRAKAKELWATWRYRRRDNSPPELQRASWTHWTWRGWHELTSSPLHELSATPQLAELPMAQQRHELSAFELWKEV